MKKNAFTLLEVLITVGIIGVVSALTIPNLVKNYQRDAQVLQLRKTVTEIENALDMLITEEGKTSLGATSLSLDGGVDRFISSKFKIIKTCEVRNRSCFASEPYVSIDDSDSGSFTCSGNSYILASSAAICANRASLVNIKASVDGADATPAQREVQGLNIELFIDVNGPQPPNIGGRDMFHVFIQPDGRIQDQAVYSGCISSSDGVISQCYPNSVSVVQVLPTCTGEAFGAGCFANILNNNWKVTY